MEETTKKRIGYIDALRGFAMILVVYFHISAYGFCSYETGYNDLIEHFRMPLFFFISGILFNFSSWKENPQQQFIRKFMALIVPTAIFMILYLVLFGYWDFSSMGSDKRGYWFTFVLFEIIMIYAAAEALLNKMNTAKGEIWVMTLMLVLSVLAFYYAKYYIRYSEELGYWKTILGLFSSVKIRHIIFFWFGTFVRKYFDEFKKTTNSLSVLTVLLGIIAIMLLLPVIFSTTGFEYMAYFIAGASGVILCFSFFRKNETYFSNNTWYGKALIYIGRRTLDVYLIHYFVLPHHIESMGNNLHVYEYPIICMMVSLLLSALVIIISLLISWILRRNSFLAKYLLGVRT